MARDILAALLATIPKARKALQEQRRNLQQQIEQIDDQLASLNGTIGLRPTEKRPVVQDKLFDVMERKKKPVTIDELTAATKLSRNQVYQALHRLVLQKRLVQKGETFSHP